jgi:hypothetical protein
VEEALRHVLPHVGELLTSATMDGIEIGILLEFLRLALFLCLVVRFYLGSVRFFNRAHVSADAHVDYPTSNYTLDFFFGLIHFSAFLALSLSIDSKNPTGVFLFWLGFILLYDFVWLFGCRHYSTFDLVKLWALINGLTFICAIAVYFLLLWILLKTTSLSASALSFWTEIGFIIPVFIFTIIDIRELFKSEPIFAKWLQYFSRSKSDQQNG